MKKFHYKRHLVGAFAILLGVTGSWAQSSTDVENAGPIPGPGSEILYNMQEKFAIDSDKINNTPRLNQLAAEVDSVIAKDSVTYVDIKGYASIDGPVSLNQRLAKARANSMSYWLRKNTNINPTLFRLTSDGEDWAMFDSIVKADPNMPAKEQVINIINSKKTVPQKQYALKTLQRGKVWQYLADVTFPEMRIAEVSLGGYHKFVVKIEEPIMEEEEVMEVVEVVEEPVEVIYEEPWIHKLYIKSNAPAWLMLWANAAVEYDFAPHWSVALPIYYSGWNYFTSKLKFRTFSVVPEVRWWPREDNMGFFLNAHLGMNLFNYAKGGEWRYQTYRGHSPALGGGVGLGYRWYFCKNHRWSMEAAVGCGVYHLDYSIFENVHNGLIVGRRQRVFFGIDQAALSFAYSFGVKQRGGAK